MIDSLAAFGPGVGGHSKNPGDIQEFAQRRVDHLREKVEAGDIDPKKLQDRLISRFGDVAGNVVGEDGVIDFEKLEGLITSQQAAKLQDRLESWFGDDARGIVAPDGVIDKDRFQALHTEENIGRLQTRLHERFGDQADGVISDNGSINIDALRHLLASEGSERSYEPEALRQGSRWETGHEQPFLDFLT